MYAKDVPEGTTFYHGTKADLRVGDLMTPGFASNFAARELRHIYFSATLEAATWGAELARGEGRGRIYIVEPIGPLLPYSGPATYMRWFVTVMLRCHDHWPVESA